MTKIAGRIFRTHVSLLVESGPRMKPAGASSRALLNKKRGPTSADAHRMTPEDGCAFKALDVRLRLGN
jgi:hypothetical protein